MARSERESNEDFGAMRDAWLMMEGLNDLDPFVGHPPCYVNSRYATSPLDDAVVRKAS